MELNKISDFINQTNLNDDDYHNILMRLQTRPVTNN